MHAMRMCGEATYLRGEAFVPFAAHEYAGSRRLSGGPGALVALQIPDSLIHHARPSRHLGNFNALLKSDIEVCLTWSVCGGPRTDQVETGAALEPGAEPTGWPL
jgi:hypothetical protein